MLMEILAFATDVPAIVGKVLLVSEPPVGVVTIGGARPHAPAAQVAPDGQSPSAKQRTHVLLAIRQRGVAPAHSPSTKQPVTTVNVLVALGALKTASAPAPAEARANTV